MSRINCRKCNLINFASDSNCRRCGNDLSGKKSKASDTVKPPRSSLFKLMVLLIVGFVCYIGYTKYTEESTKVVQQFQKKQEEQKNIKGAYFESIKNEVKKIPRPTP
jgi:hypothetical protein